MAAALAMGALLLALSGRPVGTAFAAMFDGSFGSVDGWEATLNRTASLALAGMAVSIALRMGLWNIGGEGQLLVGAAMATGVAFASGDLPAWLLLPIVAAGGALGGLLWMLIAAVPKALFGVNEIIATLFLNYIAIRVVSLLVYGPWKDPGAIGFAYSKSINVHAHWGSIPGTHLTLALCVPIVIVCLGSWLLERTVWGFGIDVAGGNPRAARYLGLAQRRRVISLLAVSGATAGIAGFVQLTSATGRLQPDLAAGYGYTGILVAFLAGRRLSMVLGVSVFFSGLIQGGFALQSTGVPSALATVIQALVILFILIGRALVRYRFWRVRSTEHTRPKLLTVMTEPPSSPGVSSAQGGLE